MDTETGRSGMLLGDVQKRYAALTEELIARKITVTVMESCSSGLIASLLTDIDHASEVFRGSFVAYSNEAKVLFGVPEETIRTFGVYSAETAEAMAKACRAAFGTDMGIGVTGSLGIRDPENADSQPGRVYFAIDHAGTVYAEELSVPAGSTKFTGKLYTADAVCRKLVSILDI